MPEPQQSYASHTKWVFPFHRILVPAVMLGLIGSFVNLFQSMGDHERIYNAALVTLLFLCMFGTALFARVFALKAQDRAIRAEESLRHYVLTGKLLDRRISMRQVIALRFAPDAEFAALAAKAAGEAVTPDEIKKSITAWRADHDRL